MHNGRLQKQKSVLFFQILKSTKDFSRRVVSENELWI